MGGDGDGDGSGRGGCGEGKGFGSGGIGSGSGPGRSIAICIRLTVNMICTLAKSFLHSHLVNSLEALFPELSSCDESFAWDSLVVPYLASSMITEPVQLDHIPHTVAP